MGGERLEGVRPDDGVAAETHKNGHSAHADAGSIGPGALDRENGAVQSAVRSHKISRCRCCVPWLWRGWQNTGSHVRRTPPRDSWGGPRSLSSAVAYLMAAPSTLDGPVLSIEGARTYAPRISTGALAILRAV